jgi:hypothetical protein
VKTPDCKFCQSAPSFVLPLATSGPRDRWVCTACGKEWDMDGWCITVNPQTPGLDVRAVRVASAQLAVSDHDDDCPVRHGASADCVWPLSVCVPRDFWSRYEHYEKQGAVEA